MVRSNRPILRSERLHLLWSDPESSACPSLMLASRPTIRTPRSVSAFRSSIIRSGVPTNWGEGTVRARRMSSTSS